jgi:fumarate hydratase class II
LVGLEANLARTAELVERSLMLVTALVPEIGYEAAAKIAEHAQANDITLRQAALANGLVDAACFDQLVAPANMVGPF